jgi:L-ascorbate metabolism protein UlaG (beta-lactamase superfamily)
MKLRWFGTATISYTQNGQTIIFDPFCGRNKKLGCFSLRELAVQGDIFITHGHFDHLADVPLILAENETVVYCSQPAADTLISHGVPHERVKAVRPGQILTVGHFNIHVFQGKHINFDSKLILRTFFNLRLLRYFASFIRILKINSKFPEGQTLIYAIEADGKKIMHMGSLNLADGEVYPLDPDILALPFQGRSDLETYALSFVEKIRPKTIYLHHFDDAFPPVSNSVETGIFIRNVEKDFPDIKVIVPKRGEVINI